MDEWLSWATNSSANILPFENVFLDYNILKDYQDFTINEDAFPNFPEFTKQLTAKNMRYIHPVMGSIPVRPGTKHFDDFANERVFGEKILVQNPEGDSYTIGRQNAGDVAYLDWFSNVLQTKYDEILGDFLGKVNVAGYSLWYNFGINYCGGDCYNKLNNKDQTVGLQFIPRKLNLIDRLISLDATFSNGFKEIDLHNRLPNEQSSYFSLQMQLFDRVRPYVLSNGVWAGQGTVSQRQFDNTRYWKRQPHTASVQKEAIEDLGYSMMTILKDNIMGFPVTGNVIGGFELPFNESFYRESYTLH